MPTKPGTRCPACKHIRSSGQATCPECGYSDGRPTARQRGYDREHETRFRAGVLARDPWCVLCLEQGAYKRSTDADHHPLSRRQLTTDGADANDPRHGRGLCSWHHRSETAKLQPAGYNR